MGLTREEACKKAQIIDFQGGYTIALVTEIYNDHEAQLKAKDEEIEKYKSLHNLAKGSLNKASDYTRLLEKQLKAKDEEIQKCNDEYSQLSWNYKLLETVLKKEKEKSIEVLTMLLTEWERSKSLKINRKIYAPTLARQIFYKAYKILKEQQ